MVELAMEALMDRRAMEGELAVKHGCCADGRLSNRHHSPF